MIASIMELIPQLASNSLYVFFFCNLIIVIVILIAAASEPVDSIVAYDEESQAPFSTPLTSQKQSLTCMHYQLHANKMLVEVVQESNDAKANAPANDQEKENENTDTHGNEEENQGEDDEEFRRRVEEFIDKVNKGWREELQGATL